MMFTEFDKDQKIENRLKPFKTAKQNNKNASWLKRLFKIKDKG